MRFKEFLMFLQLPQKLVYILGALIEKIIFRPIQYRRIKKYRITLARIKSLGFNVHPIKNFINITKGDKLISLRKETSDIDVYEEVFLNNEYQSVIDYLRLNNIPVNTIIDAGSNIGLTTIRLLQDFPDARIFCMEPDANNCSQLAFNLSKHKAQITILPNALWYREEMLSITNAFRDGKEWSLSVSTNLIHGLKIQGISLNTIVERYGLSSIELLKIDIEGAEADIFKPENDLSFLNIVKVLAIEIHDEFNCRENIYNILKKYGFCLYNSGDITIGFKG